MKFFTIIFILLNSFLFIKNQSPLDEDTSMRALSCISVIHHKNKGKDGEEPSVYSPEMLSCFMKISNEQSDRILSSLESGAIPLEDDEIEQVTDTDSLKDVSSEDIRKYQDQLETAIKEFKKFDEDFSKLKEKKENENSDEDNDNNENTENKDNNENKSGWLMKTINDWLDDNKSLFIGITICVLVCILTAIFGKPYEEDIANGKKEPDKDKSE